MKCPYCEHLADKVVDSRESKEGDVIRRRRQCLECGRRFTSYERIDQIPSMIVKKEGLRERFERPSDGRQRRTQVVRHVGDEVTPVRVRARQRVHVGSDARGQRRYRRGTGAHSSFRQPHDNRGGPWRFGSA